MDFDGNTQANINPGATPGASASDSTLVESLYKKNVEILIQNKIFSLLSKLYEISILTLEPRELGNQISQTIQENLSLECVGLFTFDEKSDTLLPLAYSMSERLQRILQDLQLPIEKTNIDSISTIEFLNDIIHSRKEKIVNSFSNIWGERIDATKLALIATQSNIKTTLYFPLAIENRVLGMVMLSMNRPYESLSVVEKESIQSFQNVISLALEKALLYKRLETANNELKELDRQKDELLGMVSHQLATPVTSMRWYLEMFEDGDMGAMPPEQIATIKKMQGIVQDLSDLVSMILDVSRIQLGRLRLEPKPLAIGEFVTDILSVIEPKAQERGVIFNKFIAKDLPTVPLDKKYTRMAIENLLSNAVKYTPKGGEVRFTAEVRGENLYFEVKDTGCGIPKEDQGKIFGKLFRASNVRNSVDGNGFGLYVAKGATENQNGKIWFESEEGKGTTFFVQLPLTQPATK